MKKYSNFEKTAIKNAAKTAYALEDKKNKLEQKLAAEKEKMEQKFNERTAKVREEIENYNKLLASLEAPIVMITGGKNSRDLVSRTFEEVSNSDGSVTTRTKFTFNEETETPEDTTDPSEVQVATPEASDTVTEEPETSTVPVSKPDDDGTVEDTPDDVEVLSEDEEETEDNKEIDPFED